MADAEATELQGDGEALGRMRPEEEKEEERPRRRVGPWERRRLAGIFSAFQALFFVLFSQNTKERKRKLERRRKRQASLENSSGRGEPTENSSGRGELTGNSSGRLDEATAAKKREGHERLWNHSS